MAYEFKKLSAVEVVAEPAESANVLIEENGVIKKAPKTAVGGGGSWDAVIDYDGGTLGSDSDITLFVFESGSYNTIKAKWDEGELPRVLIKYTDEYGSTFNHREPSIGIAYVEDDSSFYLNFVVSTYSNTPRTAVQLILTSNNTFDSITTRDM